MRVYASLLTVMMTTIAAPASPQPAIAPPDFSGIWRIPIGRDSIRPRPAQALC